MKALLLLSTALALLMGMIRALSTDDTPGTAEVLHRSEASVVTRPPEKLQSMHLDPPPGFTREQHPGSSRRDLEVVELCGLGRFSASHGTIAAGVDALPTPIGQEPLALGRERMLATLRTGAPRSRAAALLLDAPPLKDDEAGKNWGAALVQLALTSQDPAVLRWAEEGCNRLPEGPACRLSLIRARLRLEPDNAEHWAALADEDPASADEAWSGMQRSQRWHQEPQALLLATLAGVPPDVPSYIRMALAAEASTKGAALPKPGDGFVNQRCADVAARSATCSHLADVMVERSDNMQLLSAGLQLGKDAGWPDDRVRGLQRELHALARQSAWPAESGQPLSCGVADAFARYLDSLKASGELGALRSLLRGG